MEYSKLFDRYEEMNADYGVMLDVIGNPAATLASAKKAKRAYDKCERSFKLVAVAQGKHFNEYIKSYAELHALGFDHIAVGGFLFKQANSSRFLLVRNLDLVETVLTKIKETYNPKWLFPFGVYHPKRAEMLERCNVWGADYKGWIFNYVKKDEALKCLNGKRNSKAHLFDAQMTVEAVKHMTEQEIRFRCVRNFVRGCVLDPLREDSGAAFDAKTSDTGLLPA